MSRWFRLYDEMLDDPKVQMLPPELFKTWVNLLAVASRNDGTLQPVTQLAFALRVSPTDMQSRLDDLILAGLLDIQADGRIEPHNWKIRQWKSDDSADRVRKHRAMKRDEKQPGNVACNGAVTVTVTPPDTETHTETENISLPSEQEAARESEEVSRFDLVGVRVGAEAFEITTDAKRAVCAALQIGNAEPVARAYRLWPGSRRARSPDAHFRSSAPKIYRNLSPTDRAECQPLAPPEPEILITPARPSSQLAALLKNGRHAH